MYYELLVTNFDVSLTFKCISLMVIGHFREVISSFYFEYFLKLASEDYCEQYSLHNF